MFRLKNRHDAFGAFSWLDFKRAHRCRLQAFRGRRYFFTRRVFSSLLNSTTPWVPSAGRTSRGLTGLSLCILYTYCRPNK
jgi:hypothetical protein